VGVFGASALSANLGSVSRPAPHRQTDSLLIKVGVDVNGVVVNVPPQGLVGLISAASISIDTDSERQPACLLTAVPGTIIQCSSADAILSRGSSQHQTFRERMTHSSCAAWAGAASSRGRPAPRPARCRAAGARPAAAAAVAGAAHQEPWALRECQGQAGPRARRALREYQGQAEPRARRALQESLERQGCLGPAGPRAHRAPAGELQRAVRWEHQPVGRAGRLAVPSAEKQPRARLGARRSPWRRQGRHLQLFVSGNPRHARWRLSAEGLHLRGWRLSAAVGWPRCSAESAASASASFRRSRRACTEHTQTREKDTMRTKEVMVAIAKGRHVPTTSFCSRAAGRVADKCEAGCGAHAGCARLDST
jgi:hypothetical protein